MNIFKHNDNENIVLYSLMLCVSGLIIMQINSLRPSDAYMRR